MSHPYPPHNPVLPYIGKQRYFLTFCTKEREDTFEDDAGVELVLAQFLRAAGRYRFEVIAYCFMPDHVHLIVAGKDDQSDCLASIKAAKQYSGYYFAQSHGRTLWQRYGFERVLRDDRELWTTVAYILANPVRGGIVDHPTEYPHLGSTRYTLEQLIEMSEYERSAADLI